MPRRRLMAGQDLLADLARKAEVLEQELARQRAAIERLKELGRPGRLREPLRFSHERRSA